MKIVSVECTCKADIPYADGALPSFYTDEKKAVYMWTKLKRKCSEGSSHCRNGVLFPNLRDYNMYFGVHLNGEHVISVIP